MLTILFAWTCHGADVRSVWNGTSGQWTEPTNWLHWPVLPGADYPDNDLITYDVEILAGDVSIAPPVAPTIDNLILGGGSLHNTFPLVIRNSLIWTNGSFTGSGIITVSNGINISGDGAKYGLPNLKTYGASSISGAYFTGYSTWENFGSLDFQSDGHLPSYLISEGPVRKTGGEGKTTTATFVELKGGVEIFSGTLELSQASVYGDVHLASGTTLVQQGGRFGLSLSNTVITGRGRYQITNAQNFFAIPANVSSESDLAVVMSQVQLNGIWDMRTNAQARIQNSGISGSGGFLVNESNLLTLDRAYLSQITITNHGTVRFEGTDEGGLINNHGYIVNHALVEVAEGTHLADYNHHLDNFGVIRKMSGSNTATFYSRNLNNRGLVEVSSGTLLLPGGGTNTGLFSTAPGTTLEFAPTAGISWSSGNPIFSEGTVFAGAGTNRLVYRDAAIHGNVTNLSRFELTQSSSLWRVIGLAQGNFHNETNSELVMGANSAIACAVINRGTMSVQPPLEMGYFPGRIENHGTVTLASGDILGGPIDNYGDLHTATVNSFKFYTSDESGLNNFGNCFVGGNLTLISLGTNSGNFILATNSLLRFASQNYTLSENTLLTGDGSVLHEHNLTVEGNVTNSARMFFLSGILRGSGRLIVSHGAMQWVDGTIEGSGILELAPSAQLLPEPPSIYVNQRYWRERTINNFGTAIFRGGTITGHDGVLNNHATLIISNGCSFNWDGVGAKPIINNVGALTVEGGSVNIASGITNTGTFVVRNASVSAADFLNIGTANVVGSLYGSRVENRSGTLEINGGTSGPLTNNATLEVRKVLTVPSLHLSADSIINFDLGGTNAGVDYGRILIAPSYSTTELNGICNIRLVNGFSPELGQRFSLIVGPPFRKLFTRVHGLDIGGGKRLAVRIRSIRYDMEESFDLVVEATLPANPPPLRIRLNENNGYILSFPAGLEGFYIQVNTNLVSSAWHTIGVNDGQEFYWTPYTPFYPANPYYHWQSFFRLFDPDSP